MSGKKVIEFENDLGIFFFFPTMYFNNYITCMHVHTRVYMHVLMIRLTMC